MHLKAMRLIGVHVMGRPISIIANTDTAVEKGKGTYEMCGQQEPIELSSAHHLSYLDVYSTLN
jgi:hypothetical protein